MGVGIDHKQISHDLFLIDSSNPLRSSNLEERHIWILEVQPDQCGTSGVQAGGVQGRNQADAGRICRTEPPGRRNQSEELATGAEGAVDEGWRNYCGRCRGWSALSQGFY